MSNPDPSLLFLSVLPTVHTSTEHHWVGCEPLPDTHAGFVYVIINKDDGRLYIGKKQYVNRRRVKVRGRRNRKVITKESDWKTYTSSSKALNKDIKEMGKDHFHFIMLFQFETKGGLHYAEVQTQVILGALPSPRFYNGNIAGCKFIPKEFIPKEATHKLSEISQKLV